MAHDASVDVTSSNSPYHWGDRVRRWSFSLDIAKTELTSMVRRDSLICVVYGRVRHAATRAPTAPTMLLANRSAAPDSSAFCRASLKAPVPSRAAPAPYPAPRLQVGTCSRPDVPSATS
jgi:hypothetical protein